MPIRGGPHPLSPGLTKKGSVPNEKGHYHSIQIRNSFYERDATNPPILHGSEVLINLLLFKCLQFYDVIVVANKLVHRHRRMIHPTRLQEIENICKFPIFVNVPKESVH